MSKIALMCDSAADITVEQEKQYGVHVVRLPIFIDNEEFEEATTLDHVALAKLLDEKKVAKTSQPSPGKLAQLWDKLLQEYDEIFYVPVSHALSGTNDVAQSLAEREYVGKVTVVKSRFATKAIIDILMDAKKLFEQGYTTKEVATKIENETFMEAYIVPYDLQTLKRGGRISPAIASLAGFLKIQVVLKLDNNGSIVQVDKTRSLARAHQLLVDSVVCEDVQNYHWGVMHSSDIESAEKIHQLLEEKIQKNVEISELLAIVRAHTGNKTVGIYKVKKLV